MPDVTGPLGTARVATGMVSRPSATPRLAGHGRGTETTSTDPRTATPLKETLHK